MRCGSLIVMSLQSRIHSLYITVDHNFKNIKILKVFSHNNQKN